MTTLQILFLSAIINFVLAVAFGVHAAKQVWVSDNKIWAILSLAFYVGTIASIIGLVFIGLGMVK